MSRHKVPAKFPVKRKGQETAPANDGFVISYFGNAEAVFNSQDTEEMLDSHIITQTRKSGHLNLSNKGLTKIPQKVFFIHESDDAERKEAKHYDLSFNNPEAKWWDRVDLTHLYLNSNSLSVIQPLISKLEALQMLDVSDNSLSNLPDELGQLKCLRTLKLNHNKLKELPEKLCKLDDLRILSVHHNNLDKLPKDIGSLYTLESLDLSYNQFETLPPYIGYLQRLGQLNLSDNKLKSLPLEMCDLFGLVFLGLNRNDIKELPAEMSNLPKLENLQIKENKLISLPMCPSLKELHLGKNQIKTIDVENLENIKGLRVLDMSENGIDEVPDEITVLQLLQTLDLRNNHISNLPSHIGYLPYLKTLSLDGNPLQHVRRDIVQRGTSQLLKYLSSKVPNPIHSYPGFENFVPETHSPHTGSLPDCEDRVPGQYEMRDMRAAVYNKKKEKIPDAFYDNAKLAKVRTVDLSDNVFSCSFPDRILELSGHVYELILKRCKLKAIPSSVSQMKYLQYLDLESNCLTSLPAELSTLSDLREINISFNKFENLPPVLYEIERLEILIAGDNKITDIEAEQLLQMKRLAVLDLQNNKIDFVPPLLGNMTQLTKLQLQGNVFRVPRFDILSKGCYHILEYLRSRIVE